MTRCGGRIYYLGGGFNFFLFLPLKLEKIPILTNMFSKGLKPPTRFCLLEEDFMIGQPEGLVYVSVFSLATLKAVMIGRQPVPFGMVMDGLKSG